jgi:toxin HigB-1
MIAQFRHKGLEKFFVSGSTRGLAGPHAKKLRALLAALATAHSPSEMAIVGTHLHPLKGEFKGFWAVNVSGNWRLIFRFEGDNATDVDLVDYH